VAPDAAYNELAPTFQVLLDGAPPGSSSAWTPPVASMDKAEFDSFDVMQLSQQTKLSSSRKCGKCSLSLEYGLDLCLTCGEFIKGTVVCNDCNTPTQESTACTGLCRGYAALLCTPPAGKQRTFRSPTHDDVQRGIMRSKRLGEIRELRASAASSTRSHPGNAAPTGKGKGKGKGKGASKGKSVRRAGSPATNQFPCKYWAAGSCIFGRECQFKHEYKNKAAPAKQQQQQPKPKQEA
jgi:hypothetical protein